MDFSNPFSSSKGLSGSKMLDSLKESVGLKEKEQSLLGTSRTASLSPKCSGSTGSASALG